MRKIRKGLSVSIEIDSASFHDIDQDQFCFSWNNTIAPNCPVATIYLAPLGLTATDTKDSGLSDLFPLRLCCADFNPRVLTIQGSSRGICGADDRFEPGALAVDSSSSSSLTASVDVDARSCPAATVA